MDSLDVSEDEQGDQEIDRTPPIPWIEGDAPFPPPGSALGADTGLAGLLAIGGDLSSARLKDAYRQGIFPWYSHDQPILWWSPDPRMVLRVRDFRISRSMRKTLRRFVQTPGCEVRVDTAFEQVIGACAEVYRDGQIGTWITPAMQAAYKGLHGEGVVHSFETWIDGTLAGGLYGVSIGLMFFGESMFSRRPDASKIALAALVAACRKREIEWIDCQQNTGHLASLGAQEVPRASFEAHLARVTALPPPAEWSYHRGDWSVLGIDRPMGPEDPPK